MVEETRLKILITGADGMLGSDLVETFKDHNTIPLTIKELDITNQQQVNQTIAKYKPTVVINAAGYTNVDKAEEEQEQALAINGHALLYLTKACEKNNATLVHYSTDYVFQGTEEQGYDEASPKKPINHYGHSKSLGEDHVTKLKNHYLIRTSWLFGKQGHNFIEAIKKQANKDTIEVVNDQIGSPTYTKDLAKATKQLIFTHQPGTYHITNSGSCSWYEFAKNILENIGSKTTVTPISSLRLDRVAKRPYYSRLINTRFKRNLPSWNDALQRYLEEQ